MKPRTWLILVVSTAIVLAGYRHHARNVSRLEGEIKARGESIAQLSQLAAKKQQAFQKAKAAYILKPTLESCSVVLLSCESRHETDSTQNSLLREQIAAQNKLLHKDKLFGFIPRPTVQAGVCVDRRVKPDLCLSAGFPILK